MADLNALIAQGVQFKAPPDPFAQYAQMQQMQQGQTANELARYQLSSAQRAYELATNRLGNLRAAGSDPAKVANALLQSDDIKGYSEFMKSRGEQEKMQTEAVGAKLKQSKQFLETIDPTDPNAPALYMQWHKANHSDPVLGPVLAARGITPEQSMDRIKKALEAGPAAFATLLNQSKLGTEKFIELNKPTTQVIDRSGQRDVIQTPGLGGTPTTVGTYSDVPLPENVVAQKKDIAQAGSTKITVPVNVSTERKFGEMFGGKIAEEDVLMRAAALKAPEAAANANRILELVQNPNVFTGTGATLKLNIAKALNMTGATDSDSAANTEALISATGQSTLNAIKTAGLGTGQGFTDKDLRFLQGIAGGTIAMEKESIARLADIQHRVAVVTADRWASRKKSIPKSALEGTGLREETITVPPRIAAATSTPKAGIVQDGYRFKGGNPADAKNWEKL